MNLRRQIEDKHSFVVSLGLIVLSMLVGSLPFERYMGLILRTLLGGAVVLSVMVAGSGSRRVRWISAILFALAFVASGLGALLGSGLAAGIGEVALGLLAALMIWVVGRSVLGHLRVTLRTVAGALCVYLLVGLVFAAIYAALSEVGHNVLSVHALDYRDAVYFSFITQITIGYGDIVPVGQFARMLAVLEGLIGQIYIVTVIAVLVSNLGRDRKPGLKGGDQP